MPTVVVPFRRESAKLRLRPLPEEARAALAEAMLADVLAAAETVGRTIVASESDQGEAVELALPAEPLEGIDREDLKARLRANELDLAAVKAGHLGARSAEEVIAQITIRMRKIACAPGPAVDTNGSAMNAAQDSVVNKATNNPSRPTIGEILSATIPIAVSVMVKIA